MNKTAQVLEGIPDNLQNYHGIQATAIIDRNGFLLSSSVPETNAQAFGALSALIFRAAEMAACASGIGGIKRVIIESKHDTLITDNTETHMSLAIFPKHSTGLGLDSTFDGTSK
ncbi:MAG: roadblock/LC7 domain-containing protein [Methanosarcinaceae archaeon]|nr:roadblock/LC7 domain-containing protein [Methanosarcinaceae archaeon]